MHHVMVFYLSESDAQAFHMSDMSQVHKMSITKHKVTEHLHEKLAGLPGLDGPNTVRSSLHKLPNSLHKC